VTDDRGSKTHKSQRERVCRSAIEEIPDWNVTLKRHTLKLWGQYLLLSLDVCPAWWSESRNSKLL